SQRERLRASFGALLGLLLTAVVAHAMLGDQAIWMVAPIGASAVLLFCLPAPGGAAALMVVIGGPKIHAMGFGFGLGPVLIDCVVIVVAAIVYNNLTGRRYPHKQLLAHPNPHATRDQVPT